MAINRLNQGAPSTAAQIPFYDPRNGVDRRCSAAEMASAMFPDAGTNRGLITQYAAPAATGFSVAINPPVDGGSVYLLLTPVAGYAAGSIVLPTKAAARDGQELLVSSTQAVTTLTVNGNGATVNGAPSTLAANGFFRLRFDAILASWYRVG
jgi:hypothetical protein